MSYREMAQFPIQLRIWQRHMFGDASTLQLRDRLYESTLGHMPGVE